MSYAERVPLSPAQLKVLCDAAPRGLVAAGAGSGKTRLLVAYFVRALVDENVPLENLAAVTFTRKAGSELAERIRRELVGCGRSDLARSVDGAAIGTIHGLCSRLLSEQALRAGVDPSFTILEPDAGKLIKEELSKRAWCRAVEEAGENELDALASRGDNLRRQMLSLYDRLRSMGQEMPRIDIDPGPDGSISREALAHACRDALSEARRLPKLGSALEGDLGKIGRCVEWLERTAAGGGERNVAATTAFFPSRKTASAESWLAPVRAALARYRCALAEDELRPLLNVTNRLLTLFHQEYEAYKEARGVLDFADLELRTKAMLTAVSGASCVRPVFASRVLVDEFQDTNELQCAILDGLGAARLLMVGDERQSIYRFRGADVDVFRRRKGAKNLAQHRLDTNYRSRPEILDFINRLFSQAGFFGSEAFEHLVPGRESERRVPRVDADSAEGRGGGPWATEILVAERPVAAEGEGQTLPLQDAEAQAVAGRVRRLLDEEGYAQGDVVLLLPSLSHVGLYQQALLARQVDVYVVRGKGYYSQDEVADVAALLQLLVNPHDDLSLLTVLRSPLVGVSDDCLYLLGRAAHGPRARSLWEVAREGRNVQLDQPDREKLEAFVRRLAVLRGRVGRPGLSRLIDDALSLCDYDLCLLAAPEGKRRFANIRKLMRMASDFEALEGPDLAGFVALIGSMGDLGDDEGNAPSLAEGEDVVRVMTVHQAKGLEFPVVLLAGLGSDAWQENPGEFVIGSDGRAAALVKGEMSGYETSDPHWGPAPEILADERRREAEEDVRLLYVAMTRAKDKLVLVGARPTGNKAGSRRIGRIVTALGLDAFPDPGGVVALDDIDTAVIGVPPDPVESHERAARDDGGAGVHRLSEAPEPPCLLDLPLPGLASRQISFSALSAFGRCPRRFYLERVLGLGFLPAWEAAGGERDTPGREETLLDDAESHTGRDVGLVVHTVLERIDLTAEPPAPGSLRDLAVSVAADAGLHLSRSGAERAAELVAAFWDSPLASDPEIGSALREEQFFFLQGDVTVHGVMDLLCQGEQSWRIADYKSNSLGNRTPAEVAESYHMQAAVYCLAGLKAGAPAVRMELLFLEKPREPVVFEYRQEDRQRLESLLDGALAGIKDSSFPSHPGPACGDCGVEGFCRAMTSL
jgi:ATP-dependent helicase/nuclease subunit A